MYLFGVKMHERYLFPALLFLLLSCAATGDRRILRSFGVTAGAHYLNVAHVLWIFQELGQNYVPNTWGTRLLAAVQMASVGYGLWGAFWVYWKDRPLPPPVPPQGAFGGAGLSPGESPPPVGGLGPDGRDHPGLRLCGLLEPGLRRNAPDQLDAGGRGPGGAGSGGAGGGPLLPAGAHRRPGRRLLPGGEQRAGGGQLRRGALDRRGLPAGELCVHLGLLPAAGGGQVRAPHRPRRKRGAQRGGPEAPGLPGALPPHPGPGGRGGFGGRAGAGAPVLRL